MWHLFKAWLWSFIKDHSKIFLGGSIAGGIAMGGWIFSIPDYLNSFWLVFAGKMFATICSAALTGFITSLAADLYKNKWKHIIFKQKNTKENDKENAA